MNLRRIAAIAVLTIRDAVRSRLLLALVALLVVGLGALPVLIQGDGSLFGRIEIIIRYALGFAATILAMTTLWTACGGIAREIEDRRLYLILAKPVHRHEIWLGKWAAIMGLNAALLVLVGLMLAGLLALALHSLPPDAPERRRVLQQLLLARERVPAEPPRPDFDRLVQQQTEAFLHSNHPGEGHDHGELATDVRRHMLRSELVVPPQGSLVLAFRVPPKRLADRDLSITFKPASSRPEHGALVIRWLFGSGDRQVSVQSTNYPGIPWRQPIPARAVALDHTLAVTLTRSEGEKAGSLLLAPDGYAPELLVPTGRFGPNLIRALVIIWCRLSFLTALGLTAGCLLSMPVAVCAAFFVMVLLSSAGYVRTVVATGVFYVPHEGPPPEQTWIDVAEFHMFKAINVITRPMADLDPVPLMAEGRRVGWDMAARALLVLAGLYTAVTGLLGVALFRRRELESGSFRQNPPPAP